MISITGVYGPDVTEEIFLFLFNDCSAVFPFEPYSMFNVTVSFCCGNFFNNKCHCGLAYLLSSFIIPVPLIEDLGHT